jgi:hypothetical protein
MNESVTEKIRIVNECCEKLLEIYDASKVQVAQREVVYAQMNPINAPCSALLCENLKEELKQHKSIMAAVTNGLSNLQGKIRASEKMDTPVKMLQLKDPMYAYECDEDDSNYALTGRARQILESVVTLDSSGDAQPNMTTLLFGPKGNPTELFGWELVGLYNQLVHGPKLLHETFAPVVDKWKTSSKERLQNMAVIVGSVLPTNEDLNTNENASPNKDWYAHEEWVNFRKVYDPSTNCKLHKRIDAVLAAIEKNAPEKQEGKKRRSTAITNTGSFVRLDLVCELSTALEHDIECYLKSIGSDKVADPVTSNKQKRGWGVYWNQLPSENYRGQLKNILTFYRKTQSGENPASSLKIKVTESELTQLLGVTQVTNFITTDEPQGLPYCALAELCKKGYIRVFSRVN